MKVTMIRDDLNNRKESVIEIEGSSTVGEFLEAQGIERQEVLVSRGGQIISEAADLNDGDTINVFDVIAGG